MNDIFGLGNDIVEIYRIKKAIKNLRFIKRVYTDEEIKAIEKKGNKVETYAGKFSAKESIAKALGTGVRNFSFLDMEILNNNLGKPVVKFKNKIEDYNEKYIVEISISHCKEYVISTALILKK